MYIIVSNDSQTPPPLNSHSRLTDIMPCPSYLAMNPARPLWEYGIREEIKKGNNVLVVAHTNTLRGLMQVIDGEHYDNFWRWYEVVERSLARGEECRSSTSVIPLFFNARKDIGEEDIKEVSMPSGIPFVYKVRQSCSRAGQFVDSGYSRLKRWRMWSHC